MKKSSLVVAAAFLLVAVLVGAASAGDCPTRLHDIYADMHDGDKKEVTIEGMYMTIKPSGNKQTWSVTAELDRESCSASVDFNVPGKPSPPPVKLTAKLWYSLSGAKKKTEFEFTDPSGTIAAKGFPLNRWVSLRTSEAEQTEDPCPPRLDPIYADMHDGDLKEVLIHNSDFTIKPSGNNQTWVVDSKIHSSPNRVCSGIVDFNVKGKPSPPPVKLLATFWRQVDATAAHAWKSALEFTDPSGTLAAADLPLNTWVQLPSSAGAGSELQLSRQLKDDVAAVLV